MTYLFLITGIFCGTMMGFLITCIIVLGGIQNGAMKDYYYIPIEPSERDLYSIQNGKLIRIMTVPIKEEKDNEQSENDDEL